MRRRQQDSLHSSQKARFFALSRNTAPALYQHMLTQDVGVMVMPAGGRTEREGFSISVVPASESVESLIVEGLNWRGYDRELHGSVSHFFNTCAQHLMAFGDTAYEIAYLSEAPDVAPVGFQLVPILPGTLVSIEGSPYQRIPAEVAESSDLPYWIEFEEVDLARFRLPENVLMHHADLMQFLANTGSAVNPEWALDPESASETGFEFKRFRRAQALALGEVTKSIGWNARGLIRDELLEYYTLLRDIRFQSFLIDLRGAILKSLNEVLQRIGIRLGFASKIEIAGMPTSGDIDVALAKLSGGSCKFNDLLKPFSLYGW